MLRESFAVLAIAGLTGCAASVEPVGFGDSQQQQQGQAQLAAYAAAEENQFPQDAEASQDRTITALVNREKNTVRIMNYSDQPLRNVKLWVNQSYVRELDHIPANSAKTVSFGELYNNNGRTLIGDKAPITSVNLQTQDTLFTVHGPVYE